MEAIEGMDVVIACGGIGLPPLRGAIYRIIRNRARYGKITLLYGARTPKDLMFPSEYETWKKADMDMQVTVDRGDDSWTGRVGVVPMWFYHFRVDPHKTAVLTCGPEIMMRFVIYEALARRIPSEHIYVSLERNMKCGQGACGHCQQGQYFICKDGPVFPFTRLKASLTWRNINDPSSKTSLKPKVAVYKFSSCDGCQLSILNLEDELLDLASAVDISLLSRSHTHRETGSV